MYLNTHVYEGPMEFAFIDRETHSQLSIKFESYLQIFNSYLFGKYSDELNENVHTHLSVLEFNLLSKLRGFDDFYKQSGYSVSRALSIFLDQEGVLEKYINEHNLVKYDYFFIQACFCCIMDLLYVERSDEQVNIQLQYIAQMSVSLAEIYSSFSFGYDEIELTKDKQASLLEEISESKNDFIYSLGELSKLTSRYQFVENLLTKLRNQYIRMSAAEGGYKNLFEYMGYLKYIGSSHFLYEMGMNELENDIINELRSLTLPDLAFLLEHDFYDFVDDNDLEFQGWEHLTRCVFSSDQFNEFVDGIKSDFLDIVPEYSPD